MATMTCPRCQAPLDTHEASRLVLHGCPSCGGIWLDGAASQRVVESIDPGVIEAADAESHGARARADVERPAACPICARPLDRMRIEQAAVDVDACREHGVWFDRDELQRVIRAVAPRRTTPVPMAPSAPSLQQPQVPAAPNAAPQRTLAGGVPYIAGAPIAAAQVAQPAASSSVPYVAGNAAQAAAPSAGGLANPAAAFFTDDSGAPAAGAAAAPPAQSSGWGVGKTALAVGGGVAAVAGVAYVATETDFGRNVVRSLTGSNPGAQQHPGYGAQQQGGYAQQGYGGAQQQGGYGAQQGLGGVAGLAGAFGLGGGGGAEPYGAPTPQQPDGLAEIGSVLSKLF